MADLSDFDGLPGLTLEPASPQESFLLSKKFWISLAVILVIGGIAWFAFRWLRNKSEKRKQMLHQTQMAQMAHMHNEQEESVMPHQTTPRAMSQGY